MKVKNNLEIKIKSIQKYFWLYILISSFPVISYGQAEIDSLLNNARYEIGKMSFRNAVKYLNEVEKIDSLNPMLIYLHSEMKLIYGEEDFLKYFEKLRSVGADELYHVMKLKHAVFIGLSESKILLQKYLENYPENGEIKFVQWLLELDDGKYEICMKSADEISKGTIFKVAPYLALFNASWDNNYKNAITYIDTVEQIIKREFYGSKYREILEVLSNTETIDLNNGKSELPFAWCGPGVGYYMIDEKGDSLRIKMDTGTGFNLMTVHDKALGERTSGIDILVVENGISYNYMDKPADLYYKKSNFSIPAYRNFIFGYFDSQLIKADGCASPFVFKNRALHIDPINEKVYLLDHENLEKYINDNKDIIEKVPYIVRNGWIYVPCKINGTEVLMQIETGSRDVNFYTLSLDPLGLESYPSSIEWNGQDFPIDKVDCILEIGSIKYEVKGGLVADRVFANWYYGLAAAGDIGPFFMNKFVFTIDMINQQIIFEIK